MRKKFLNIAACALICGLIFSGCGKDNGGASVETSSNLLSETSVSSSIDNENAKEKETPEASLKEADEKSNYEKLLDGEMPFLLPEDVLYKSSWNDYSTGDFWFGPDSEHYLGEFVNTIAENNSRQMGQRCETETLSYHYIDCGNDGNKELAVRLSGENMDMYAVNELLVFKDFGDQIKLVYEEIYGYRTDTAISDEGVITNGGSSGARSSGVTYSVIDKDGVWHYLYSCETCFGFDWFYVSNLDVYLYDVANELGIGDEVEIDEYSFAPYDNEKWDDYSQYRLENCMFTILKTNEEWDPEFDPSIYEEGSPYMDVWDYTGFELSTPEEIDSKISEVLNEHGIKGKICTLWDYDEWDTLDSLKIKNMYGRGENLSWVEVYKAFLSNRTNFMEILSQPMGAGYSVEPHLISGFYLYDFDKDSVPELLIGAFDESLHSHKVFVYTYDKTLGCASLYNTYENYGRYGEACGEYEDYGDTNFEEIMDRLYKKENSLMAKHLYVDKMPCVPGLDAEGNLVLFDLLGMNFDFEFRWGSPFFGEDRGFTSYQELYFFDEEEYVPGGYTQAEASKVLETYKPIRFYEISKENIDKFVIEDYTKSGIDDYSLEDVYYDAVERINSLSEGPVGEICYIDFDFCYSLDQLSQFYSTN